MELISTWRAGLWALHPAVFASLDDALTLLANGKITTAELAARVGEARKSAPSRTGNVAVVPIVGVLARRPSIWTAVFGGSDYETIGRSVRALAADPAVESIVLHVDSPGGDAAGVDELAADVYRARRSKPVVARVDGMAASAAYWIASQAKTITATPSSEIGSVGVFTSHSSIKGALEQAGIETTVIASSPQKSELHPALKLSEDARSHLQERVDEMAGTFVGTVARGRGVSPSTVRASYGKGRTLGAAAALRAGMIDQVVGGAGGSVGTAQSRFLELEALRDGRPTSTTDARRRWLELEGLR